MSKRGGDGGGLLRRLEKIGVGRRRAGVGEGGGPLTGRLPMTNGLPHQKQGLQPSVPSPA